MRPLIAFESEPQNKIQVSDDLRIRRPAIAQTKASWAAQKRGEVPYGDNKLPRLNINVSKETLPWALRLLQALFNALEQRGHTVAATKMAPSPRAAASRCCAPSPIPTRRIASAKSCCARTTRWSGIPTEAMLSCCPMNLHRTLVHGRAFGGDSPTLARQPAPPKWRPQEVHTLARIAKQGHTVRGRKAGLRWGDLVG